MPVEIQRELVELGRPVDFCAFILYREVLADSIEEFNRKEKRILECVRVIDSEGNDMMRRDLLPELK